MSNREGYIYEVVEDCRAAVGTILVLTHDDGTNTPYFDVVKGSYKDGETKDKCCHISNLEQLWPRAEEEPVETITLMGKEYNKQEIEAALADVLPVGE